MSQDSRIIRLPLINIDDVIRVYEGDIGGMTIPKVRLSSTKKGVFNDTITQDSSSDIFAVVTKSGEKIVTVCSSCTTEGEVECKWCSYKINVQDNVGIITFMEISGKVISIGRTGFTCTEECSLAYVIDQKLKGKNMPRKYANSDYYHRTLHNIMYPDDGPLMPANNPDLLKSKGGSLTREQWRDTSHIFVENSHMIISNLKTTFTKCRVR